MNLMKLTDFMETGPPTINIPQGILVFLRLAEFTKKLLFMIKYDKKCKSARNLYFCNFHNLYEESRNLLKMGPRAPDAPKSI